MESEYKFRADRPVDFRLLAPDIDMRFHSRRRSARMTCFTLPRCSLSEHKIAKDGGSTKLRDYARVAEGELAAFLKLRARARSTGYRHGHAGNPRSSILAHAKQGATIHRDGNEGLDRRARLLAGSARTRVSESACPGLRCASMSRDRRKLRAPGLATLFSRRECSSWPTFTKRFWFPSTSRNARGQLSNTPRDWRATYPLIFTCYTSGRSRTSCRA